MSRPRDGIDWWTALAIAVAALALLAATGCTAPRPATEPAPQALSAPSADAVAAEPRTLREARAALAEAQAQLAGAQARVAGLEQAQEEARREGHRRLLAWIAGICLLASIAAGVAALLLPVLRRTLLAAAAAAVAAAALSQGLSAALPWLPIAGVAVVLVALVAGLWLALRAAAAATGLADRLKLAALTSDPTTALATLESARESQGAARPLIQALRRRAGPVAACIQEDARRAAARLQTSAVARNHA